MTRPMSDRLYDLPTDPDAPLRDWLKPVSATMRNPREMAASSAPGAVTGMLKRVAARRRAATPGAHDATIREVAAAGCNASEIGRATGLWPNQVARRAVQLDLTLRKGRRKPAGPQ